MTKLNSIKIILFALFFGLVINSTEAIAKSSPPVPPKDGAVNTPVNIAPSIPPTPWIPKTSKDSSAPNKLIRPEKAHRHTKPAIAPMIIAPMIPTEPQAGVIATKPEIIPEAAPSIEGFPFTKG